MNLPCPGCSTDDDLEVLVETLPDYIRRKYKCNCCGISWNSIEEEESQVVAAWKAQYATVHKEAYSIGHKQGHEAGFAKGFVEGKIFLSQQKKDPLA